MCALVNVVWIRFWRGKRGYKVVRNTGSGLRSKTKGIRFPKMFWIQNLQVVSKRNSKTVDRLRCASIAVGKGKSCAK